MSRGTSAEISLYPTDRPSRREERPAAGGSGQALPASLRDRFEGSLSSLSAVRVHTGLASARAAQAAHAQAFTLGQDIHFSGGAYDPVSREGQRILAHEVAHTVQQADAGGLPDGMTEPGDAAEPEGGAAAPAMVTGQSARVSQQPAAIARILRNEPPAAEDRYPARAARGLPHARRLAQTQCGRGPSQPGRSL